jgi:hypothetical protein
MERLIVPMQPGGGARSGATPSPSEATHPEAVSRENGNVPSGPPMNSSSSLRAEGSKPRNELPGDQTALAKQLEDDFALVQLDTTFVTLLSEISALEPEHSDDRGRRDAENVRSDEVSRI